MKTLIVFIAGIANALAFAPFNWWPLGLLSFGILFYFWLGSDLKTSVKLGFVYGLGMFGVGISWMYISIHTFGGMPPVLAGLCIAVLVSVVSLFPAISGAVQSLFVRLSVTAKLGLVMPVTWIFFEWMRSWVLTGLPWLSTGYSMIDTPLSNFAPIGGVYLVGLITLISVGVLMSLIRSITIGNTMFGVVVVGIWASGWLLNETSWTKAHEGPLKVSVIQNNISISEKWDQQQTNDIIQSYLQKSRLEQDVDLIVMPEAAIPDYIDNLSTSFWDEIRTHPADFIFGVLHRERIDDQWSYYNTVAGVSDKIMIYRKQHLVPFGEYFPLRMILDPLIKMMNMPMSDFSHWNKPQAPLHVAGNRFAASICYEDAFPADWRNQVGPSGALINVSEDIWFGDSLAPHQRLQMARFRARESERPMIRSSNNGLSALINWKGGIDIYAPQFVEYVVRGSIQPRTGVTPYIAFGDVAVLIFMGVLFLIALLFGRIRVRL